ncbi:MAG: YdcF family protein [Peptococcaceae bacterium]|jgi:uncharacterized SAM-binding protein YcdF (DUF218 family)|nr:YdcF family protein [Peptococcaceae bacterium]
MKKIFFFGGSILILYGFIRTVSVNFNLGAVFTILLGLAFWLSAWVARRIIRYVLNGGIILCLAGAILLTAYGSIPQVTYQEDALIILGAGVNGERLTIALKSRLDKGVKYLEQNPTAIVVVSGGQGPQESVSEAYAMEKYLLSCGITAKRILKEDLSTSTAENFRFSKNSLDAKLTEPYTVAFVTNNFHLFRAGIVAQRTGLQANGYGSTTSLMDLLPSCLREIAAVLYLPFS